MKRLLATALILLPLAAHAVTPGEMLADPALEAYGYFTIAGGEQAMTALLAKKDLPTAVFAMSDEMAFGAVAVGELFEYLFRTLEHLRAEFFRTRGQALVFDAGTPAG